MVVEAEPDLYNTLLALLSIWSIDGVAFTNGYDAASWIEDVDNGTVQTNLPELALLDIRLPGSSGPEIAERLRQSPVMRGMTIVLTTAYHLSPDQEDAVIQQAQADALMYKPLPAPRELRIALERAIAKRQR